MIKKIKDISYVCVCLYIHTHTTTLKKFKEGYIGNLREGKERRNDVIMF